MNSTVKFTVFDTNSGKSLDIEAPTNGSIEIVKNKVNDVFLIENKYQILLFGSEKENYKTFNNTNTIEILNGKNVFLYNLSNVDDNISKKMKLSTIFEQDEMLLNEFIFEDKNIQIKKKDNINDAIKNALISYEFQFSIISEKIYKFIEFINKYVIIINNFIKENENYLEASRAVLTNLMFYNEELKNYKNCFDKKILEIDYYTNNLLKNFKEDIEKLSQIELHPVIKNETYKKLIDYIPFEEIKNRDVEFKKMYTNFTNKVENINNNYENFYNKVNLLNEMKGYIEIKEKINNVKININNLKNELLNYNSLNDSIKNNIIIITNSLDKNENVLNICHMMDNIFLNNYENNINCNINTTTKNLQSIFTSLNVLKKECVDNLNETIKEVSIYQKEIVKIRNCLFSLNNVINTVQNNLFDINIISNMSQSYKESINEIIRRQRFKKKYIEKINLITDELSTFREEEIKNRELFREKYVCYLPKKYISFEDLPAQFQINLKSFDENLPGIEDNHEHIEKLLNEIIDNILSEIPDNLSVIENEEETDIEFENTYLNYFKSKYEYENKLLDRIKELENENKELKKCLYK